MNDMNMSMGSPAAGSLVPLSPDGVDFSNETQAMDFLAALLDDSVLQVTSNAYARIFWYGIAVSIGVAAFCNFLSRLVRYWRLRAAASGRLHPAKPANIFTCTLATVTALAREICNLQYTPLRTARWLQIPPFGTIILLTSYFAFILTLERANNDVVGAQHWQALGVRAGWLAVAQVPLVILLAGKNNLIGLLTGQSFQRLNIIHRWVSRGLLLLATLHFGYQSTGWNEYGVMQLEWSTDTCPPTGIAAYAILLWMNLSTLAPLRRWNYEFFVVQHLITFFGFIIALMMHLPSTALYSRVYIYIAIGLYIGDRLIRSLRSTYLNYRPAEAILTTIAEAGEMTSVIVHSKRLKSWKPGSFVLLSIPRFGMFQSHPATILSTPSSHGGDLVFLLRSQKGFTRRILQNASAASSSTSLLSKWEQTVERAADYRSYYAFLDGPYGACPADFATFDTTVLIAGGTGITFCISLLLNLAECAAHARLPLRKFRLVWILKTSKSTSWFASELRSAIADLRAAGIEASVDVYLTCDQDVADTKNEDEPKACGCACDKTLGRCCCLGPEDVQFAYGNGTESSASTSVSTSRQVLGHALATEPENVDSEKADSEKGAATSHVARDPGMTCYPNRPVLRELLYGDISAAHGETGVAVCGPLGLSTAVRQAIVSISDERAIHKGTGAQGVYLHVEHFGW